MKYIAYVDGQLGLPFDDLEKAIAFAHAMEEEGFEVTIYEDGNDERKERPVD